TPDGDLSFGGPRCGLCPPEGSSSCSEGEAAPFSAAAAARQPHLQRRSFATQSPLHIRINLKWLLLRPPPIPTAIEGLPPPSRPTCKLAGAAPQADCRCW
ncbi:hypothetical protein E2320_014752, partial [Naja naja]